MASNGSEYEVGYGKPPAHSQFKKGESGNPKGRPKGSLNLATALNRALREKVTIVERGRRTQVTKLDAAVKGLVNRAVKGDAVAMRQMLGLAPLVGAERPANDVNRLGADDAQVLASLIKRLADHDGSAASSQGDGA